MMKVWNPLFEVIYLMINPHKIIIHYMDFLRCLTVPHKYAQLKKIWCELNEVSTHLYLRYLGYLIRSRGDSQTNFENMFTLGKIVGPGYIVLDEELD